MTSMRKLAALAAVLALLLAACGGDDGTAGDDTGDATSAEGADSSGDGAGDDAEPGDQAAPVERGGTLSLGTLNFPSSFAVAESEYGNMSPYYQAVYDGLLRVETDGKTFVPWLATDWSYNDDNTVLTMTLRDDVTFSDGTPFDAEAAAANLKRFPEGGSPDASNLANVADAVAVDATTLEITLSAPDPAFLSYLARNAGLIQSPASFEAADEATNPVGSGPYLLDADRTVTESVYTFVANPDYWAPETVLYDEVVLKPIADPTAMVNALKAGELNGANLLSADTFAEVEASGFTLNELLLDWAGLTLVDKDGAMGTPLADVRVRQALNMAFDREAIVQAYTADTGIVTTQVFQSESAGYDPALDDAYPYDPERARELLAEAGYPDGFELEMPSAAALGENLFAIIADSLAEIGITVSYTEVAVSEYFDEILAPNYPAYFMILERSANDWQFIQFLLGRDAVWNPSHYGDDTTDGLIDDIQVAPEGERDALVAELGAHVHEEAWWSPWYINTTTFATDSTVSVTMQTGNAFPFLWNFVPAG